MNFLIDINGVLYAGKERGNLFASTIFALQPRKIKRNTTAKILIILICFIISPLLILKNLFQITFLA